MAEPFLSEIRMFSFGYAPTGWALCNGQTLLINSNQALFALIGTIYGGNGQTTFQLPNLQGRVPMHFSTSHTLGESAGETSHTLNSSEMPSHNHLAMARNASADTNVNVIPPSPTVTLAEPYAVPQGGGQNAVNIYSNATPDVTMGASAIASVGGGQAHTNQQPFLTISFCIALQGIFPSRN